MNTAIQQVGVPVIQISSRKIPRYPDFAPLTLALQTEVSRVLAGAPDGVSEYTFANLYLFRGRYSYRVSMTADETLIISGAQPADGHGGGRFFMTPCGAPGREVLEDLFTVHEQWKAVPDSVLERDGEALSAWGVTFTEDRDNFDYLYLRTDLAELSGKKYHKKRNLVNAFVNAYTCEAGPLTPENTGDALAVLDRWREARDGDDGDYQAGREALACAGRLGLTGEIFYVDGKPVGWCLGECLAGGQMYAVHFEKGLDEYKGVYQFINQHFAASLPESVVHINREQDLGDEELRQAKMTYRPSGFVRKCTGHMER